MKRSVENVRRITDKILEASILVLFLVMFGVTVINVFMRYVMNSPLSFSVELGRYTFAAIVYLGSIFVMRSDGHIGLDIIVEALPKAIGSAVRKLTRILVLAYLGIFCYESLRMVMTNWANRSSTMQIPMSIVYIVMVIGSVGMFIEELLLLLGINPGKDAEGEAKEAGGGM